MESFSIFSIVKLGQYLHVLNYRKVELLVIIATQEKIMTAII